MNDYINGYFAGSEIAYGQEYRGFMTLDNNRFDFVYRMEPIKDPNGKDSTDKRINMTVNDSDGTPVQCNGETVQYFFNLIGAFVNSLYSAPVMRSKGKRQPKICSQRHFYIPEYLCPDLVDFLKSNQR